MKSFSMSVLAVGLLGVTSSAMAADLKVKAPPLAPPPSPWDVAFGGALMSDYNLRGISQSNRGSSVTAYVETRYNVNSNLQLYWGSQYWAVTLPTDPSCECDFYGGFRPTVGPLSFDFGYIYYWYPKERQHASGVVPKAPFPTFPNGNTTLADTDYWEVYGKVSWDVLKDKFALGANYYYSPDWLGTGAYGAFGSVTAKVILPSFKLGIGMVDEVGWFVSGELGHYWLGTTDLVPVVFTPAINLPDYTTWNVGVAFTWKAFTFDLRYYDTNLSRTDCNTLTGDPNAVVTAAGNASKWCDGAVVGALKFDLTAASLK